MSSYSPKYLRAEPIKGQAAEDAQVLAMIRENRSRIEDEELTAMVRRNPRRKPAAEMQKPEENIIRHNDTPMLILSGLLLIVTLAVSLAAVLV